MADGADYNDIERFLNFEGWLNHVVRTPKPYLRTIPTAPETGGRSKPKSVAATRRFRWTTRAEIRRQLS